jgi:hypothetical protein
MLDPILGLLDLRPDWLCNCTPLDGGGAGVQNLFERM